MGSSPIALHVRRHHCRAGVPLRYGVHFNARLSQGLRQRDRSSGISEFKPRFPSPNCREPHDWPRLRDRLSRAGTRRHTRPCENHLPNRTSFSASPSASRCPPRSPMTSQPKHKQPRNDEHSAIRRVSVPARQSVGAGMVAICTRPTAHVATLPHQYQVQRGAPRWS